MSQDFDEDARRFINEFNADMKRIIEESNQKDELDDDFEDDENEYEDEDDNEEYNDDEEDDIDNDAITSFRLSQVEKQLDAITQFNIIIVQTLRELGHLVEQLNVRIEELEQRHDDKQD